VGDDLGELAAGPVDLALHGGSVAPFEHGGDQFFDHLKLSALIQRRPDVVHELADHLLGRRRPTRRIDEITFES
jgi:hypothetical protein